MKSIIINLISLVSLSYVSSLFTTIPKLNIFNDFKNYSVKCPELSNSYLSDPTSLYFEECISFPSEIDITKFNEDKYFCAGVLDAEYKLCNVLTNKKFDLPKDKESLNQIIHSISQTDKNIVCSSLKRINDTAEPLTKPFVDKLNTFLKNTTTCPSLCQGVLMTKTNEFCSLISYIYDLIDKIKAMDAPKTKIDNSVVELKSIAPKPQVSLTTTQLTKSDLPVLSKDSKTSTVVQNTPQIQSNSPKDPITMVNVEQKVETKTQISQSSTSTKSTTKTQLSVQIANVEQTDSQGDKFVKNEPASEVKDTGVVTGTAEEQKFKDNQFNTMDESKEDGPQPNEDPNYDQDDGDFDMKNEENFKAPSIPQKEFIEKEIPEKLLISPGKKYPTQYEEPDDSNFFTYFMFISVLFIGVYVAYHNKQKILALVLEGRRDRNSRRRPNTASYRKLNSNLEEAVTSKSGGSASNIIY